MDWRVPWEGKHWVQGDGEAKLTEELSIYTARAALGDIVKIGKLNNCHLCFQPLIKKWVLICKDLGCMKQQSKASTVLIVGQTL